MSRMMLIDYPGGSGGYYSSDTPTDTKEYGSCLTAVTYPVGSPIMTNTSLIEQFFGGPASRNNAMMSAIAFYVPFIRYYYDYEPWSVVQSIDLLQNVSWGGETTWNNDLILDTTLDRFQDPHWLWNISDPRFSAIRKSLQLITPYIYGFISTDWFPLIAAATQDPENPSRFLDPALFSAEFKQRKYNITNTIGGPPVKTQGLRFITLRFDGVVIWYFGKPDQTNSSYAAQFPSRSNGLFGVPFQNTIFRDTPAPEASWAATGAMVEYLQSLPFIWVDAMPVSGTNDLYYLQMKPVDGVDKRTWTKMHKAGWISDSDMLTLQSCCIGNNTQLLVERALQGIGKQLAGQDAVDPAALAAFYSTQFLFPLSNQSVSYGIQGYLAQSVYRYNFNYRQNFNPMVELVRFCRFLRFPAIQTDPTFFLLVDDGR
jgi:hypothetical protein